LNNSLKRNEHFPKAAEQNSSDRLKTVKEQFK
jgi:hypothetical protein